MASGSTASSRRATREGRAAQTTSRRKPSGAGDKVARARRRRGSPVELRPLRLAALALLLVAAAFYVSPLRAFFAQQDRYDRQVAALAQAQATNRALHTELGLMRTRDFITRQAREQYQLVPAGLQAFVVKGLPRAKTTSSSARRAAATPAAPSIFARLSDLWHTIRE